MSELIARVLQDVGGQVEFASEVWRKGPFAMVCANVDWMTSEHASFEELFDRFVLPTPKRVNAHRAEVLLVAVCDGVLAMGSGRTFSSNLELSDIPIEMAERAELATRALIWKYESRTLTCPSTSRRSPGASAR